MCPTYVSHKGKWYAAKERVALKNKSDKPFKYKDEMIQPGQEFIYEGPDREALKELAKREKEYFGKDFRTDPDFIKSTRTMGFPDVETYLKQMGYDEKADDAKFKEKASVVSAHELPKKVKEIKIMATGGRDTSGSGKSIYGGLGTQPEI